MYKQERQIGRKQRRYAPRQVGKSATKRRASEDCERSSVEVELMLQNFYEETEKRIREEELALKPKEIENDKRSRRRCFKARRL